LRRCAGNPCFDVLLENFLGAKTIRHGHHQTLWEKVGQERREKRLRSRTNRFQRQDAPLLQTPLQGLHSGSGRHNREDPTGRFR
jgi:hypothetical protein